MKKIYCKYLPVKPFIAMLVFFWVIVREDSAIKFDAVAENHERIHFWQLIGCMIIGLIVLLVLSILGIVPGWSLLLSPVSFYVLYALFWIIELIRPPYDEAYISIPFEVEAYKNEEDMNYCSFIPPMFSWMKYFKRISK